MLWVLVKKKDVMLSPPHSDYNNRQRETLFLNNS